MTDTRMETYYGFVSTSEDALALFEACRLGYKQRVPRRLSDAERAAIRSGSIFVWEENESGMKRWTDGRSWSPSRVQGCFLTYHEWEGRRRAQRHPTFHTMHGFNMSMLPASMAGIHGMPSQPIPMGIARYGHFTGGPTKAGSSQVQYGFPKENGMLKKALSIKTNDGKKLHIIAYYSKEDHARRRLLTPTNDPNFPKLVVPPNLYPDMSPESMYGASHSLSTTSPTRGTTDLGPRTRDSNNSDSNEENTRRLGRGHSNPGTSSMDVDMLPSTSSPSHSLAPQHPPAPHSAATTPTYQSSKTRVQSLVDDAPSIPGTSMSPSHHLYASQLPASRPSGEHQRSPHSVLPMNIATAAGMRPSSNSFSSGTNYQPASYSHLPAASQGQAAAPPHYQPSSGYKSGPKYLGLGGPLGLGGGHTTRRAPPARSITTAGVYSRNTFNSSSSSSHVSAGEPLSSPLATEFNASHSPMMCDTAESSRRPSFVRGAPPPMPLLLSPVHPPQLPQPASAGGAAPMLPDYTPINLAGIRGDVKEGPRRLPSISASLRNDSPPETTCSLGGLGILHTSVSAARSSALPSPMPTPRQTASLGFDGERTSPPHRNNYPDSLSLLATTADRSHGQQRQASVSSRSSMHPYSRSGRRGPSMRSVSLKQSEDIRQLGVLDQSLKLK